MNTFHFRMNDDETHLVGTTEPNQDANEAKANGHFVEATLEDGPRKLWHVVGYHRGNESFHFRARMPAEVRERAQAALTAELAHGVEAPPSQLAALRGRAVVAEARAHAADESAASLRAKLAAAPTRSEAATWFESHLESLRSTS